MVALLFGKNKKIGRKPKRNPGCSKCGTRGKFNFVEGYGVF
jgi:hypothetical protein